MHSLNLRFVECTKTDTMPFIKIVDYEESTGELRKIYDDIIKKRGKLAEVHKLQSLHPATIPQHIDFYLELMFGNSPLKRYQREMIGVVVSAANNCDYCVTHHSEPLNHYWKDEVKVRQLAADYRNLQLDKHDRVLCDYAFALTQTPHQINEDIHIRPIKNEGWTDQAILDTALITAYFNFVNRMVMGTGIELEKDQGKGYLYE
jgi:uncharacterized peroxidase-related enzyme